MSKNFHGAGWTWHDLLFLLVAKCFKFADTVMYVFKVYFNAGVLFKIFPLQLQP